MRTKEQKVTPGNNDHSHESMNSFLLAGIYPPPCVLPQQSSASRMLYYVQIFSPTVPVNIFLHDINATPRVYTPESPN